MFTRSTRRSRASWPRCRCSRPDAKPTGRSITTAPAPAGNVARRSVRSRQRRTIDLAIHNRPLGLHPVQPDRRLRRFPLVPRIVWAMAGILSLRALVLLPEHFSPRLVNHARYVGHGHQRCLVLPVLALAALADLVAGDLVRCRAWHSRIGQDNAAFVLFYLARDLVGLSPARLANNAWPRLAAQLGMLVICASLSVYVLNLGYSFEGTFTPLGKYRFVSDSLGAEQADQQARAGGGNRFEHSWLATIFVPLPKNYVEGIDLQKRDFEHYGEKSYLNGVWSDHGWWYYYLEALALKVPVGTWLLLLLAATRRLWCRSGGLPISDAL